MPAARLEVLDESAEVLLDGGVGLIVNEGACSTNEVRVTVPQPVEPIEDVLSVVATQ
jgi:hypothetical protein